MLGFEHLDTTIILVNLARLYESQGKCEQAELLFQRALTKAELLGTDLDIGNTLYYLAEFYEKQGKYEQAEPLLKRALELKREHVQNWSPNTSHS
ncbi:uncharacterized protein VTP21DRAFT_10603 [Calcarisporiella thermophila]|uniref:uncharacterized protein n=1 Tax=Calcarisporiella thermophila TaxID=911321 RepID=UPI0037449FE4